MEMLPKYVVVIELWKQADARIKIIIELLRIYRRAVRQSKF